MGSENWQTFHKWQNYNEILKTTPIISFYREDDMEDYKNAPALKEFQQFRCNANAPLGNAPQWRVVKIEAHNGRATTIRNQLAKGQTPANLTKEQLKHIQENSTFSQK